MAEQDFSELSVEQMKQQTSPGGKLDNVESSDGADGADEPVSTSGGSGGAEGEQEHNSSQEPQERADEDGSPTDDVSLEDAIFAAFSEVEGPDGGANPRVHSYDPPMAALLWALFETEAGEPYRDGLLDAIEERTNVRPARRSGVAKQLQRIGLAVVAEDYFTATQEAKNKNEGGF